MRLALGLPAAVLWAALLAGCLTPAPAHADYVRDGQWHLRALRMGEAWAVSRGQGVTVAVLDTGVDGSQPDLAGQVVEGPDLVGGDVRSVARSGGFHGTAMASLIAAHGHGPGGSAGAMGIAPAATILSIRVIREDRDPVHGSSESTQEPRPSPANPVTEGIRYAVDHGAQVINLSLGNESPSPRSLAEDDSAIQYALAHGVVVVTATGNSGTGSNKLSYPAGTPGVIAVAAADSSGRRAGFSTHNWSTSVAAPGVDIVSATSGRDYIRGEGTSQATAIVSGVCALIRARYPLLSPAQVRTVLEKTATRSPGGGYDEEVGWGMVQPVAALQMASTLKPRSALSTPAPPPGKYFGDGRLPVTGLGVKATRLLAAGLVLVLLGLGLILDAAMLAVLLHRGLARGLLDEAVLAVLQRRRPGRG